MQKFALELSLAISKAGGKCYITGGYTRDLLLGIPSTDIDIEVFNLSAEKLEAVLETFGEVNYVGKQYGVYKVKDIDVSLPRLDEQTGEGRRDLLARIHEEMPLSLAAVRRDLTMNAIYLDPLTGKFEDPFNGIPDLRILRIKHVNVDTFMEDPLRILRVARFRAIYPFMNIEAQTMALCKVHGPIKVKALPQERVFNEVVRVLMNAPLPSVFFKTLEAMDILDVLFPELVATKKIEQGSTYHPEGSVYNHTLMAIDAIPVIDRELDIMLALLFHDLGKGLVPNEVNTEDSGKIHFKGHAEETSLAEKAIARLTNEIGLTESAINLIKHHMRPYDFKKAGVSRKAVRKLAASVDMYKLVKLHKADRLGRGGVVAAEYEPENSARISEVMRVFEEIKSQVTPIILGRDLIDMGMEPGKHFGAILQRLYEDQMEEKFLTREDGLLYTKTLIEKGEIKNATA